MTRGLSAYRIAPGLLPAPPDAHCPRTRPGSPGGLLSGSRRPEIPPLARTRTGNPEALPLELATPLRDGGGEPRAPNHPDTRTSGVGRVGPGPAAGAVMAMCSAHVSAGETMDSAQTVFEAATRTL